MTAGLVHSEQMIGPGVSRIGALRVVSRTTAMHYKRVHRPLREIAQELVR